jgi:histidinol dehydrogenase
MRMIDTERALAGFLKRLRTRGPADNPAIETTVKEILEDVAGNGDGAVLKYTRRYDDRKARRLRLSEAEISRTAEKADARVSGL